MNHLAQGLRIGRSTVQWVAVLALMSCGGSGGSTGQVTPQTGSARTAPVIESFTADPAQIAEGDASELSWVVSDPAATVKIVPMSGSADGTTATVRPVVTTTFTLTVTNALGFDMAAVTVSVLNRGFVPAGTGPDEPTETATDSSQEIGGDLFAASWVDAAANLEGLSSECGNLTFVSSNPNEDMMIAGVALQGLWSSTNGSDMWEPMGQGQGSAAITNRLSSIVYDPADPDVFWQSGVYNGGGVYKTVDKGVTFTQLGDVTHSDLVSIDFTDSLRRTMLSGTHERAELFLSPDGGTSWLDIAGSLPSDIGYTNAPLVMDGQTFLLGTMRADSAGVYRTTDRGATWVLVFPEGVKGQPLVTPSDGAIYWLLEVGDGVITSTDGGLTWTKLPGVGPRSTSSSTLVQLPDGRIVAIGDGHLVATADKGETWQRVGPALPYEPNGFAYSPHRNSFFAWRFDCNSGDNPIPANAIIRLDPLDAESP